MHDDEQPRTIAYRYIMDFLLISNAAAKGRLLREENIHVSPVRDVGSGDDDV